MIPFVMFWVLMFFGRDVLGFKGILVCIAIWVIVLTSFIMLGVSPYIFFALQSVFDIILILLIFNDDIRLW